MPPEARSRLTAVIWLSRLLPLVEGVWPQRGYILSGLNLRTSHSHTSSATSLRAIALSLWIPSLSPCAI
jgi:hypothetical protein